MATRLEITENFAIKLADASRKERKKLLKNASKEQLKGLFEICLNIIRGNQWERVTFKGKAQKYTINFSQPQSSNVQEATNCKSKGRISR